VISHNAANYTAWQYRRRCLDELHKQSTPEQRLEAWRQELCFCDEQCRNNMKNYQVWFHRRTCVERLGEVGSEMEFVAEILEEDSKNYHAWGHRQWVLRRFGVWEHELAYVEKLIRQDVRNNSAWNQRYFVLSQTADLRSLELVIAEVQYAISQIELAPNNPSPWSFLKGLTQPVGFESVPQVKALCERLSHFKSPGASGEGASGVCVNALALLVDVLQGEGSAEAIARAHSICMQLQEIDSIRAKYWQWRRQHPNVK